MRKLITKLVSAVLGFFARAAVTFKDIFDKGSPSDNPAGKGTENDARPRKRLVDGINTDRFTQLCAVVVIGFVSIIGAVLIAVGMNSGSHRVDIDEQSDEGNHSSGKITLALSGSIMPSQDMLDSASNENEYNFDNYMSELSQVMTADISVAGLCGQIDVNDGNEVGGFGNGNNYPYQLASAISSTGINYVFGANNHAFDNGYNGMCSTVYNLHRNSLSVIGLTDNDPQKLNLGLIRVNGINVGLAGYNCTKSKNYDGLNDERKTYMANLDTDSDSAASKISSDIKKMRESGIEFIVICINWGTGSEKNESDFIKSVSKKVAEAGADVIVGYGPYITMKAEIIECKDGESSRKCHVFYSLGCLLADMTESKDYSDEMSRSMTVTLSVSRGKDGTVKVDSAVYNPIYTIKNKSDENAQSYLKYMAVPAVKYVSGEKRPDIFTDEEQWKRCKKAFDAICSIADKSGTWLALNELETSEDLLDVSDGKV